MIAYNELHQIFEEACYQHRRDEEFSGFRWTNRRKVRLLIHSELKKFRKSGLLEKNENGKWLADSGTAFKVTDSVRWIIVRKRDRMIDRRGNDNGWSENCFLFLNRVRDDALKEIARREAARSGALSFTSLDEFENMGKTVKVVELRTDVQSWDSFYPNVIVDRVAYRLHSIESQTTPFPKRKGTKIGLYVENIV